MIFIFFGPPGAGKGTQAKFISEKLNIAHLSTGDVLREQLKKENKLSLELNKIIKTGKLVSDNILNQIVVERISQQDCKNGFIFDGYPRTIHQASFVDKYFLKNNLNIDYIIEFSLDQNSIIKRIENRALIERRTDDSKIAIATRLEKYTIETKPVLLHYQKKYALIYHTIDGGQEIEQISTLLLKLLRKQ